jgi:predicted acylesterase/phospholipase RssA
MFVIRPGHDEEQSADWRASIVKASASVPFVFSPTSMKKFGQDLLLMDGGTTWNNNMVAAINECMAMDEIIFPEQISVDVITLDPYNLDTFTSNQYQGEQD